MKSILLRYHAFLSATSVVVAAIVCCAITGCQAWHTANGLPGMGLSSKEKKIVERAIDDPFPSPRQVGIESCDGQCQE